MKPLSLGIFGGVILGVSLPYLYWGFEIGMLTCGPSNQSELCRDNYVRTGWAELAFLVGLLLCVAAAVWRWRQKRAQGS